MAELRRHAEQSAHRHGNGSKGSHLHQTPRGKNAADELRANHFSVAVSQRAARDPV
jgi:hypothetical protein